MSWRATTWAISQKVGNAGRKLLLLALANYADENGFCWPSQCRLSSDTEASLDTVQRQTRKLVADGFISIERPPKRRGQWQTFVYRLSMSDQPTGPQDTARSDGANMRQELAPHAVGGSLPPAGSGGKCGLAGPQPERKPGRIAVRLKPSIEPPIEPSFAAAALRARETDAPPTANPYVVESADGRPSTTATNDTATRLRAFQGKREPIEVTQNRIAQRLGGWSVLMEMDYREIDRITALERRGQLDDETLRQAALRVRASRLS